MCPYQSDNARCMSAVVWGLLFFFFFCAVGLKGPKENTPDTHRPRWTEKFAEPFDLVWPYLLQNYI